MFIGTVNVKLSSSLKWEDRDIIEIALDFSKVKGATIIQCERETFQHGNFSGVIRSQSSEYCARMAALISGVPFRFLEKLPADDYDAVWQTVGAYVGKRNPQEFYDQFTAEDEDDDEEERADDKGGFTEPAETPEEK
ncbi:MAG: hypothetical protein LBK69_06560 [Syntrophomonadaceae bacterium]|jgi:hypothetical protein|nr:hypothetical protein [Syntrophomonadaceae bacterium]